MGNDKAVRMAEKRESPPVIYFLCVGKDTKGGGTVWWTL